MSLRVDYSVLNQRETPSLFADVFSNRPAFGFNGRLFISIDTKQIFRDYGTNWELIADAGSGSSNLQQVCTNGNFTTTDIDMLSGNLILRNLNPGGVLFTNTSEIVSQDINNFFWDDTNNRLGIGTNTPTAPLDVHSTGNILQQLNGTSTNNTYLAFLNQDIGKWRIGNYYNSGDNDFVIYDTFSGVTRAFFTNTGYTILPTNLIIGSSNRSSAYGMDVYVSANYQSTLRVQGASTFLSQLNGTLGVFSTYVQTPQVQASTSAGLSFNSNSGTQVALLGAGGGSGITLFGGLSGTSATFSTTLGVTGLISGTTATLTSSLFDQFILTGGTTVSTRINIKRGSDDTNQNMLIGWNNIKLQRLNVSLSGSQTDFSILQEGSNGSRTPFYISSDANIGINTTNPTNYGSINSSLCVNNINSGGGGVFEAQSNGNSAIRMACSPTDCAIWEPRNVSMLFATNNTPAMRISNSGNLLINTATDYGFKLSVVSNNGLYVRGGTSSGDSPILVQNSSGTNLFNFRGDGRFQMFEGTTFSIGSIAGTQRIQYGTGGFSTEFAFLQANDGYTPIGASAFNTRSDYRLKEDLKEFIGLSLIKNMKVYDFKWKEKDERNYGFMAHELQEILPYVVTGIKDGMYEDKPQIQGLDYGKIVPVLVKAIQELNEKLERHNIN